MSRRVVVTGMAGLTPLGSDVDQVFAAMLADQSGVRRQDDWDSFDGLRTRLAGGIPDFQVPPYYPRKKTRSMGRVSLLAARATELAIEQAGLTDSPYLQDGRTGIAYGSSSGSTDAIKEFVRPVFENKTAGIVSTTFIRMMSHTCAANLGQFFQIRGRIIPTCSACTSGSQGVGYGYEAIKFGRQEIMIAGGAEELCISMAIVFDILFATSTKNNTPHLAPAPYDRNRDGLVVGEGAATLILESLEHAQARGAKIYGEIIGFGNNSDGLHITNPSQQGMAEVMKLSLQDAGLEAKDIDYICGHGTATAVGDVAESKAVDEIFGPHTPISSLKGHMGHTLGACGAIESWLCLKMMENNQILGTKNLVEVDPECAALDYVMVEGRKKELNLVMNNNFAFGGINTSLIFKKFQG